MSVKEIRVGVRSGGGGANGQRSVKVAVVAGGPRPILWLGAGEHDGIAWVSGRDTLRRIRDALTEALGQP